MADLIGTDETWGAVRGKLNGLARRGGIRIAVLGDSISENNHNTPLTGTQSNAKGYMAQAAAFSRGVIYFGPELNFGVGGDTAAGILARTGASSLAALIAARPDRVHLLIGTNDINQGVAKETVWSNIVQILDILNSSGIPVDVTPVLPRTYNMTATKRDQWGWLKAKIYAERFNRSTALYGVTNMDEAIVDRASATGDPIANTLGDGLHPVDYGAILLGYRLWNDYYAKLYPYVPRQPATSQADVFSTTNNIYGSINPYPVPTGTGGTAGTGASGSVATGYTLARTSGATLTLTGTMTSVADPSGVAQDIAVGRSGAGASAEAGALSLTTSPVAHSIFPAGQKFYAEADIELINPVGIQNVQLILSPTGGTPAVALVGPSSANDREIAARKVLTTPYAVVATPGGENLGLTLKISVDCSVVPSGTVRVRSITIRALPN